MKKKFKRRINTEKQYYALLDNLADAIIHTNQAGEIVYCNPVVEKYFDYTSDELLGKTVEILIPHEFQQAHISYRDKYQQEPTTCQMSAIKNISARRKNGETFAVDINLSTLYSEEGLLISAEIRDISDQLLLKNELETQRQFFEDAFSKTPDGIILTDAEGQILLTNPSLSDMLGYQAEELAGKHARFLYDDSKELEKMLVSSKQIDSEATGKSITIKYKHKKGSTIPGETTILPVKDKLGVENGHFIIVRDISERLKMEQEHKSLLRQLIQAQKMEALGHLTGGVAHDFNNILASMMGFAELAYDLLDEEDISNIKQFKAKLSDYLDEIQTGGKRAKVLIEQMLTFSRTGNNGILKPCNLNQLLNDAIKMLRPVLPTSIRITAFAIDDLPKVMADPVQIHQVLMNICINARDAMKGKGRIDMFVKTTHVKNEVCSSCQRIVTGDYIEIVAQDTGPGIDHIIMERLFEPFFTTKKIGKGTGMGLAMVHGILHHHHGHIVVENNLEQGSSFRLLFPQIKEKSTTTTQLEIEQEVL